MSRGQSEGSGIGAENALFQEIVEGCVLPVHHRPGHGVDDDQMGVSRPMTAPRP